VADFSKQFGINYRWTYKATSNQDDKNHLDFIILLSCYFIIKNDLFIGIIKFTGVITDYRCLKWSRQLNYITENWPKIINAGEKSQDKILWIIFLYCDNDIILSEIIYRKGNHKNDFQ
jgi:hypothetical protein